jgi:hypothetical protein
LPDCEKSTDSLDLNQAYFDKNTQELVVQFSSNIALNNKSDIKVFLTYKGGLEPLKIKNISSSEQELLIKLSLEESEVFKGKDVNFDGEKMLLMTEVMLEIYK